LDGAPFAVESVALVVRDLDAVTGFYRDVVGLIEIAHAADAVVLGVGGRARLELRRDPSARRRSPDEAGLFHTAFLLPNRGDLGAWLTHAASRGVRVSGAADHLVSEALYLDDPEGNGIEIYADRPSAAWPVAEDSTLIMRNAPLDLDGLMRAASGPWAGMPKGTRIGHVHLQVGAVAQAEDFYAGLLGFDVTCRYPGAAFLGSGGYHHQLAVNAWNSRGAPARGAGTAGVAEIGLRAHADVLTAARGRFRDAGLPMEKADGMFIVNDPWGLRLRLVPQLRSDTQDAAPNEIPSGAGGLPAVRP
jgi:catechol 2,3-dioxygenase